MTTEERESATMPGQRLTYYGWHFSDGHERYGARRPLIVGKTLRVQGMPVLCAHGLHASARALDALCYGMGGIASWVRLEGIIIIDTDKAVATVRTVLAQSDATQLLHEFACWCAEQALLGERANGREPDPRSWKAIEAKRRWLHQEIDDRELAAARAAARDAAGDAARDAAWDAARDAQNAHLELLLEVMPDARPA